MTALVAKFDELWDAALAYSKARVRQSLAAPQAQLEDLLLRRRVGHEVRERILRLNPRPVEGRRLRGWHYKRFFDPSPVASDLVPRGEVIRRFGRTGWEQIPRQQIIKAGRRQFATRFAVMRIGGTP